MENRITTRKIRSSQNWIFLILIVTYFLIGFKPNVDAVVEGSSSESLQTSSYVLSTPGSIMSSPPANITASSNQSDTDESMHDNISRQSGRLPGGIAASNISQVPDWNSTLQLFHGSHQQWCPRVDCSGNREEAPNGTTRDREFRTRYANASREQCLSIKCFDCDCDPRCRAYGSCCTPVKAERPASKGWKSVVGCAGDYFAMVRCPSQWSGEATVRESCENGTAAYTRHEPVTDPATGLVYRNAACAVCHGVRSYQPWTLTMTCQHWQFLYSATSQQDLLQQALNHPKTCFFTHSPPAELRPPLGCPRPDAARPEVSWVAEDVTEDCNVTGQWAVYDRQVEAACKALTSLPYRLYLRQSGHDRFYANLFCAVCNGLLLEQGDRLDGDCYFGNAGMIQPEAIGVPPFSLLFGLSDDLWQDQADPVTCADSAWLMLNNECRNLTCTSGKTLINGTCITAVSMIAGLAYTLDASFVLTPPVRLQDDLVIALRENILQSIGNFTIRFCGKLTIDRLSCLLSAGHKNAKCEVGQFRLVGNILVSRNLGRDDAERAMIDVFFRHGWEFVVENTNVSARPQNVVTKVKRGGICSEEDKQVFQLPYDGAAGLVIDSDAEIDLTPSLVCPFIEFDPSEFVLDIEEGNRSHDQVMLLFGEDRVLVPQEDNALLTLADRRLQVCYEVLTKLNVNSPVKDRREQILLSLIVLPTSIMCLLLTVVVYSLLPALRTLPGLNVMGTCLALFLAQLSLLLASQRTLSGLKPWCLALGMLVHATWLSFFSWTWLCSLHMYRAFSANTFRPSAPRLALRLARNLAFTLLLPALVVALVVTVSYVTSGGRRMGYGDGRCFLSDKLLVGLTMVFPVAMMLTANLVLFVLTSRHIYQVSNLSPHSDRESQHHVHVCLRLSVLTGVTWVLSLIAETLDVDWLQSVSIVANGGQGVLLFLSYVVSRRVAAMLAVRLGLKTAASSLSARSNTSLYVTSSHG